MDKISLGYKVSKYALKVIVERNFDGMPSTSTVFDKA
jgi:hypothetical protein